MDDDYDGIPTFSAKVGEKVLTILATANKLYIDEPSFCEVANYLNAINIIY